MPLKRVLTAPPITLSNVKEVFESSTTLFALRRGNDVPNIANAYGAVSTTTPQLLSYQGLYYPPALRESFIFVSSSVASPETTSVIVEIGTFGTASGNSTIRLYEGGILVSNTQWRYAGHQADYQVMFNKNFGATPSGDSVNTWLSLSSTRSWILNSGVGGEIECSGWFAIRMANSPNIEFSNTSVSMAAFSII